MDSLPIQTQLYVICSTIVLKEKQLKPHVLLDYILMKKVVPVYGQKQQNVKDAVKVEAIKS